MIEIIPNWHPIFVHFTVGLFSTACGFYVLSYLFRQMRIIPINVIAEFEVAGRWCLWVVAVITIFTVIAGLYAYYTISRHDNASHMAMIDHRNWALPTAGAILLLSFWSMWRYYKGLAISLTFVMALLIVQGMLLSTAWHGGEVVYRYGIGVISLPQEEGEGHDHLQGKEMKGSKMDHSTMPGMKDNANSDQQTSHAE